jgi:hypothetical protein
MAERHWRRLKQSEVMDYGGELPVRVVLEQDEEDHAYRIFLETVSADGKLGFKAPRFHYWLEDAIEDSGAVGIAVKLYRLELPPPITDTTAWQQHPGG